MTLLLLFTGEGTPPPPDDPETRPYHYEIEHVIDEFLYDIFDNLYEDPPAVEDDPETRPWLFEEPYDIVYGDDTNFTANFDPDDFVPAALILDDAEPDANDLYVFAQNFDPDDHVPVPFWPLDAEGEVESDHSVFLDQLVEDVAAVIDDPETRAFFLEEYHDWLSAHDGEIEAGFSQAIDEAVAEVVVSEWLLRARRRARR